MSRVDPEREPRVEYLTQSKYSSGSRRERLVSGSERLKRFFLSQNRNLIFFGFLIVPEDLSEGPRTLHVPHQPQWSPLVTIKPYPG